MNDIQIYKTQTGTDIQVNLNEETVWITQKDMAELFQTTVPNINMHLKNIFDENELDEISTIKDFLIVRKEGNREVKRIQKSYNLDVVISVGYRIKSKIATQFRIWATQRLKEYLVQGYTINQKRLDELGRMINLIEKSGKSETVDIAEAKGLLDILSQYTKSFVLLNQ